MSTYLLPFTVGTVTIANGQKAVVVNGGAGQPGLANNCMPGDELLIGRDKFIVGATAQVTDAGFELLDNFTGYIDASGAWVAGAISVGVPARIKKGAGWGKVSNYNARLAEITDILRSGQWTSLSPVTIGDGNKDFAVSTLLPARLGARIRAASAANPATHWMEGTLTAYDGTTMRINVASSYDRSGAGSRSDWVINIAGARGAQGAAVAVPGAVGNNNVVGWDGVSGAAIKDLGTFASLLAANIVAALAANQATDAVPGAVELATTVEAIAGLDTARAVTPAGFLAALRGNLATDAVPGSIELATLAEAIAAADTSRAVTPAGFLAALRGNLLGVVSQSGGAPTGKVFDFGTASTGSYLRFPDGTQICWKEHVVGSAVNSALGSFFVSAGVSVGLFPASFASTPIVVGSGRINTGNAWAFGVFKPTLSQWGTWRVCSPVSNADTDVSLYFIAIGRWY